jgi:hypothetical protein
MKARFYEADGQVMVEKTWGIEVPQSVARKVTEEDKRLFKQEWAAFRGEKKHKKSEPLILTTPAEEADTKPKKLVTEV